MAFGEKFEDTMMTIAEVVGDNKYLMAIKDAFTAFMPFIIIGSMGTLLKVLISSTTTGLAIWVPQLAALEPAFTAINFCTMSFMTLPIIFLIAMNLAKSKNGPEHASGVVSVAAYISMCATTVTVDGVDAPIAAMANATFGAQGLFVGMLTALLITSLFCWLTTIDAIKIKMPPSVPAGIANSFNIMIPVFFCLAVSSLFGIFFRMGTGQYVGDFIYAIMQAPLEALFNTPFGIVGMVLLSNFFWLLGIHGGLIVTPVRNPMFAAAIAANTAALAAGTQPDQIFTMGFWNSFLTLGGAGGTLCLIFATFLFSKREDHRAIAKLGILPGLCGISEPIVFGFPLVLNPTFAIPFILCSPIQAAIAVFATNIGFLPCNTVDVPFGIPILLNGFIGHGWQGVAVQLIILAVGTLVWIPFVLMANRQAEKEAAEAQAA
ncbi:MAG: PTS sugar transporter subunit IIC [Collinsella stercoris]|uniref:PTS sugar transporter subunit IIC n=1 Tax=Collinsella stercoris TaxID=147206 RepID=UPI003993D704